MSRPIDIDIDVSKPELDQLCDIFDSYKVGYVRMIDTHPRLTHIKEYVLNNEKNKGAFEKCGLKLKTLNIIDGRRRVSAAVANDLTAIRLAYDIKCFSTEDQIFTVYSKFRNSYSRMLETNAAFKTLYAAVLEDKRNNTKLFKNAPTWVKAANLIKSRLMPESLNKFNEYIRSTVLTMLDSDSRRIDYLRRTCQKPVQTLSKYKDIKARVVDATKQLGPEYNLTTRCFWVMHKIAGFNDQRYKCQNKNCEKSVLTGWNANDLNSVPYKYCCAKCRANDEVYKNTLARSIYDKYGVRNALQNKDIQNKAKTSMLDRHHVEYAAQSPEIYEKVQASKLLSYGNTVGSIEKLKRHFTPELNERIESIFMDKYGVKHPLQNAEIHKKTVMSAPKSRAKPCGATSSSQEDLIFKSLGLRFGNDNVIRHYKSEQYPFYCDFYIKTIDAYIEFNGYWMHGGHAFDQNSADDRLKLNKWVKKSKGSKSYASAVNTWTVRDPFKRRIALQNKLNYIVLWTMNDAYAWIESLGEGTKHDNQRED